MRIFSPLGIAQTSLALRSLVEKIHNSPDFVTQKTAFL